MVYVLGARSAADAVLISTIAPAATVAEAIHSKYRIWCPSEIRTLTRDEPGSRDVPIGRRRFGGPTRGECMRHTSDLTIPAVGEMARSAL